MIEENIKKVEKPLILQIVEIFEDVQTLVHQEILLAKCEVKMEVSNLKSAIIYLGLSLICAMVGFLLLCFSFVYGVSYFIPAADPWLSFALVSLFAFLLSTIFIFKGLQFKNNLKLLSSADITADVAS